MLVCNTHFCVTIQMKDPLGKYMPNPTSSMLSHYLQDHTKQMQHCCIVPFLEVKIFNNGTMPTLFDHHSGLSSFDVLPSRHVANNTINVVTSSLYITKTKNINCEVKK